MGKAARSAGRLEIALDPNVTSLNMFPFFAHTISKSFILEADYPCWCGETQARTVCTQLFVGRRFAVLECTGCRTYRILPRAVADESSARQTYNTRQKHNCLTRLDEDARVYALDQMIRRVQRVGVRIDRARDVLDVGCADGELLAGVYRSCTGHAEGVDIDETAIILARQNHPELTFHLGFLSEAKLEKPAYDLVIASAILEHVPGPLDFLMRIRRIVKEDGEVFLLTPNANSLNFRVLGSWWRELLSIGEHIYLFSPASLGQCARAAGFEVASIITDFDPPPTIVWPRTLREAMILIWGLYCRAARRCAVLLAGSAAGDILSARLVPVPREGQPPS